MEENKLFFPLDLQLFGGEEEEDTIKDEDFVEVDLSEDEEEESEESSKENKSNASEESKDDEEEGTDQTEEKKQKQSRQENSRQAQLRRERENKEREDREKKIQKEAFLKGQLDQTKVNTFTNEKIEDEHDLKIFNLQKKIQEEGGDPINDLPKYFAKMEREEKQEQAKQKEQEIASRNKINKDIEEFKVAYPDVNVKELLEDKEFSEFADDLLDKSSLKSLYEKYRKFTKKEEMKEEKESRKKGSSPSSSSNGQKDSDWDLSDDEVLLKERKDSLDYF